MLVSTVIDHLSNAIQAEDVGIAYVYCSYQDRLEQTLVNLLASLLKQLLQEKQFIPKDLENLYEEHIRRGTRPTHDEVFNLLQVSISRYSRVYIVIDALDECSESGGRPRELLSMVRNLTATAISLMVTSRFIPTIAQHFEQDIQVEIRASKEDVQRYLCGRMEQLSSCVRKSEELRATITQAIVDRVDGM